MPGGMKVRCGQLMIYLQQYYYSLMKVPLGEPINYKEYHFESLLSNESNSIKKNPEKAICNIRCKLSEIGLFHTLLKTGDEIKYQFTFLLLVLDIDIRGNKAAEKYLSDFDRVQFALVEFTNIETPKDVLLNIKASNKSFNPDIDRYENEQQKRLAEKSEDK